jgi:hypothetical protein
MVGRAPLTHNMTMELIYVALDVKRQSCSALRTPLDLISSCYPVRRVFCAIVLSYLR